MHSNYYLRYVPLAEAINSTTIPIPNATGCASSSDQLACLQAVNATELINLKPNFNYPVFDGMHLTSTYIDLNASAAGNTTLLRASDNTPNASAILANFSVIPLGTGPSLNNTALD
ncbi:hypothetical protein LTR17_002846 [Elasticomyces elasticus]|nr:hypothetical protein LTR17_002846 [Elasticomyces elasticus]